jgi:hypothetical protein
MNLGPVADLIWILTLTFDDSDYVGTPECELCQLRQNNRDFASYVARFQQLVSKSSWDAVADRSALMARLLTELNQVDIICDLLISMMLWWKY